MFSIFKSISGIVLYFSLSTLALAEKQIELIDVEITTHVGDAQTFVEGDQVSFMLSVDKAAYIYLFYEDADNNILQLLPNQKQIANYYQPGLFMPVPDPSVDFKFAVQPPFGEEKIWVFATDRQLTEIAGQQLENGLFLVNHSLERLTKMIKSLSMKQYGISYLTLVTKAR